VSVISEAPERVHLPIHSFQGDKDPYITPLSAQWNDALKIARDHGYTNFDRTIIAGVGHSPLAWPVVDYFATLLPR
jgi:hypothetical protein